MLRTNCPARPIKSRPKILKAPIKPKLNNLDFVETFAAPLAHVSDFEEALKWSYVFFWRCLSTIYVYPWRCDGFECRHQRSGFCSGNSWFFLLVEMLKLNEIDSILIHEKNGIFLCRVSFRFCPIVRQRLTER